MKLNVAVIFGGRSVEHEISIISAHQVISTINNDKYNVIPIYITKHGRWYAGKKLIDLASYQDVDKLLSESQEVIPDVNAGTCCFYRESKNIFIGRKRIHVDIIFPVMHGTYGEDGVLQGLFEVMNIPYVGCNVLSSAAAMDKVTTKILLKSAGVNVLDYYWFYGDQWINNKDIIVSSIKSKFDYPLIVKPANLGSSIGVAAVNDDSELEDAVDLVVRLSHRILIEPKVVNLKEVNCSVLGDRDFAEVSVCEEPVGIDAVLSYKDKYAGGAKNKLGVKFAGVKSSGGMAGAKRKIPAEISKELSDKIQDIAKQAFIKLDCSGVVRIDFLIDQGTNEIYLCELNTIPGSLSFYLWEYGGKGFSALIDRLIELALKRHREDNNLVVTYSENILKMNG